MVAMAGNKDPTVVDQAERKLIEQYAGASLADSDPKEVQFIVEQSKIAGNKMFREKKFKGTRKVFCVDCSMLPHQLQILQPAEAIQMYSQAIAGDENDHKLFGNRSASYLAIGLLEKALWDAQKSVKLKPDWAKGYYRIGCALESLNDWNGAYIAFSKGSEMEPTDETLKMKMNNALKRLEEDTAARNAASAIERHNLVIKLRNARHEDQKLTMMNQFKQSMTAPEWDLEDLEWRPTWMPNLRKVPIDAQQYLRADPRRPAFASYLSALSDLSAPKSCVRGLEDHIRLSWFSKSIKSFIKANSETTHVLVVSSGGGILGLMAAETGISQVTQIERSRMLYRMAKQIISSNMENEFSKNINLVSGVLETCKVRDFAEEIEQTATNSIESGTIDRAKVDQSNYIHQKADVLVTDLLDHTVLGMGILKAVDYAAEYLLKENASVVPAKIKVVAQLIEFKLGNVEGFDLTAMDYYRWYPGDEKVDLDSLKHRALSKPFDVSLIDLESRVKSIQQKDAARDECQGWELDESIEIDVSLSGNWNAVAFWFELCNSSGDGVILSSGSPQALVYMNDNSRLEHATSWGQAVQYLDGRKVAKGSTVQLRVQQERSQIVFSTVPDSYRMRHAIVPRWHYDMICDFERNSCYRRAIERAVAIRKDAGYRSIHALDMGAGSGILSMLASRAGASYTYAAEMSSHLCDVAEECTIMNGFLGKILVLDRDVRRMDVLRKPDGTAPEMERPADIAVFEVFDSGLIGEGVLHILAAAKSKLLMPDATLVPCRADVYAQPIQMRLTEAAGFNIEQANRWRWRSDYEGVELGRKRESWVPLAPPLKVFSFDFYEVEKCAADNEQRLHFEGDTDGVCNAIAMWFKLHLDEENSLSTSPYEEKGPTWQQAVQYIGEVNLRQGDSFPVLAKHDTYSISYSIENNDEILKKRTSVPLYDDVWKSTFDRLQSFNSEIVKACVQNPLEYRFASQTAVQFAARPHDLDLDASQAYEFCTKLMS